MDFTVQMLGKTVKLKLCFLVRSGQRQLAPLEALVLLLEGINNASIHLKRNSIALDLTVHRITVGGCRLIINQGSMFILQTNHLQANKEGIIIIIHLTQMWTEVMAWSRQKIIQTIIHQSMEMILHPQQSPLINSRYLRMEDQLLQNCCQVISINIKEVQALQVV